MTNAGARTADSEDEILQFHVGERLCEFNRGLACGRIRDLGTVLALGDASNLKIEIGVVKGRNASIIDVFSVGRKLTIDANTEKGRL